MGGMIDDITLSALHARLARALAPSAMPLVPLAIGGSQAGWLTPERAARVVRFDRIFRMNSGSIEFVPGLADERSRSVAMAEVAQVLAEEGALSPWRDERYAVAAAMDAAPWFLLERAAARYFGVHTTAAHLNGLVASSRGTRMWLARRSPHKAIDPSLLDNLVGGGVAAGTDVARTVVKEAWEEAGIDAALAIQATPCGTVRIRRIQPDGLHWETIHVHDLWLPSSFVPANQDGEAVDHRLVSLPEAARLAAQSDGADVVTADASLVILDCLLRQGAIPRTASARDRLEALVRRDYG
jgi:8-oxo-dGTP pyrophosphatase MutT (NUDIX family)